jgi:serine protease
MLKLKAIAGVAFCLSAALSTGTALADKAFAGHSRTSQLIVRLSDDGVRRTQAVGRGQLVPGMELPDGRQLKLLRRVDGNAIVVQLPEAVSLDEARTMAAELAAQPGIAAVEPDKRFYPALVPTDPEYLPGVDAVHDPGQWNLFEDTAGIRMPAAWDQSTGSSAVVVAVLDTGIIPHRDLGLTSGRVLPGYDFFSNVGRDNDGTPGRDSDPTDPGDATVNDECGPGEIGEDSSWHGLSVTGVIGAESDNNLDIAGIDFNARLLPIRVLGKCGGDLSDVADAIRWAAGLPVTGVPGNPTPAKVINLSLTGAGACSQAEQSAINAAVTAGAVVVVAAGNEGGNVQDVSPANCMNVIVVGAIARDGRIAAYSNVGANIDLTAPGGDDPVPEDLVNNPPNGILTLSNFGTTTAAGDALAVIQGTSFSAAQVSAVVSLMFAVNPALTPGLLENVLKGSTRAFPDASCNTSLCGTGVLDASAALAGAADPTSVVGISANTSGGGGCTLSAAPRAFDPLLWLLAAIAGCVPACRRFRC